MEDDFKKLREALWELAVVPGTTRLRADAITALARIKEELTQLRRVTQQVTEEPPPVKEDFQ